MHLKVLACEVACREIGYCAASSPHVLDTEFLPVGHHDEPKKGHLDLQRRIDALPAARYDAVLVGYGVCNLMLNGLRAGAAPLVIPRAHDCITFFLGSKERYQEVFNQCPGTYYFTAGWLEFPQRKARAQGNAVPTDETAAQLSPFTQGRSFAELVAKYGEDNARYLMEMSEQWTQNYQRGVFIQFDFEQVLGLQDRVADICRRRGWRLDEVKGDLNLLRRWLGGEWDPADFLVVQPGQSVSPSYDEKVIDVNPSGPLPSDRA